MSTLVLKFIGTVKSRSEASGLLKSAGDAVLIERGRPRWLLISCPCGCGDEFPINLDPCAGPAWRFYKNKRTGLSLFPSVWRDSGCCSHYIIWRNLIIMFGQYDDEFSGESQTDQDKLTKAVLNQLPTKGLVEFSEVAEALGEVPWDVLMVCRQLTRKGLAREGAEKQRGSFGRV